jgi:predicted DCC family thiol-disulfide oxidoreductase YuxK
VQPLDGIPFLPVGHRPTLRCGTATLSEWRVKVAEWRFKVLYDGECPFCRLEARWLNYLSRRSGQLVLEDIAAAEFDPARYGCTLTDLMGSLHGVFPDGTITRGMETFRQAYRTIGLGWLLAPTAWPVLRPLFDWLYVLFARYRVRLGGLFGRACVNDRCSIPRGK